MSELSPETKEWQTRKRERYIADLRQKQEALVAARRDPATLAEAAEFFGIDLENIPEDQRDQLVTIFLHTRENDVLIKTLKEPARALPRNMSPIDAIRQGNITLVFNACGFHLR